jgi:hypothetical protein
MSSSSSADGAAPAGAPAIGICSSRYEAFLAAAKHCEAEAGAPKIPVTPEMLRAGYVLLMELKESGVAELNAVYAVYRAMRGLEPHSGAMTKNLDQDER